MLSPDEPAIGQSVHHTRVAGHLAWINRDHKLVVNTIADSDPEWNRSQLDKLFELTGEESC